MAHPHMCSMCVPLTQVDVGLQQLHDGAPGQQEQGVGRGPGPTPQLVVYVTHLGSRETGAECNRQADSIFGKPEQTLNSRQKARERLQDDLIPETPSTYLSS